MPASFGGSVNVLSPGGGCFPSLLLLRLRQSSLTFWWPLAWTTSNGSYSAVAFTKDLIAVVSRISEHHSPRLVAPVLTFQVARASFSLCWPSSSLYGNLVGNVEFRFQGDTFPHMILKPGSSSRDPSSFCGMRDLILLCLGSCGVSGWSKFAKTSSISTSSCLGLPSRVSYRPSATHTHFCSLGDSSANQFILGLRT